MTARAKLVLAVAILGFIALTAWLSGNLGTWHEELSVYPSGARRMLLETSDGGLQLMQMCSTGERVVVSQERPVFSLCVGDRTLPIMVTSYFAGWLYWPVEALRAVHRDQAMSLRVFGIFLGVLELLWMSALVRRIADDRAAICCTLAVALSTPYVYVHALLVHYEFVPWLFIGAALLTWLPREGELSRKRFLGGALLFGLAIAGNIKSLFILAPLLVYAWRTGVRLPEKRHRDLETAALLGLLPLVPLAWFAMIDPSRGLSSQLSTRLGTAARKLLSPALLREPLNLLQYWTDVGAYGDVVQNIRGRVDVTWILPALSLAYVVVHGVRAARGREHDRVAGASAFLIVSYVFVVVLMYDQQPEANYAPLHTVLGVATGAFCVAAGRALAARVRRGELAIPLALTTLAAAGFTYNTLKRGNPAATMELPFNGAAQRALAQALVADGDVITTTYNLAGVPDSFGSNRARSVEAHLLFGRCPEREQTACVEEKWRKVLAMKDLRRPLAIVMPVRGSMVDEPFAAELLPTLERAAASVGATIVSRDPFTTTRGVPVLLRVVVR